MSPTKSNPLSEPVTDPAVRLQQRRLRKGTRSCWECKRKKARCSFTISRSSVCDGCQRRGTLCIGQEQPEPYNHGQPMDRLGRVEAMLCQLTDSTHAAQPGQQCHTLLLDDSQTPSTNSSPALQDIGTTVSARETSYPVSDLNESSACRVDGDRHDGTLHTFLQAWPTKGDLGLISQIPIDTMHCVHDIMPLPTIDENGSNLPRPHSLSQVLKPPLPKSHPTIYARLLLTLALSLQAMDGENAELLGGLSTNHRKLMERAVSTAHAFLNSEGDEPTTTLEGIQCLALESLYYTFTGNLKRSWIIIRRAITLAQLMGLHRDPESSSSSSSSCPPNQPNQIIPHNLWFEIINIDSYLCLVLGLPKFGFEFKPVSGNGPDTFEPQKRLRRAHCAVAEAISKRNSTGELEGVSTDELGRLLQKSAAWMPPRWWSEPTPACSTYGQNRGAQEAARIRDQLTHYNLIVQLHWPTLINPSSDESCDKSCIAAANASRELLACFIAVNMHRTAGYYCRGISILALVASAALCVAHARVRCRTESGLFAYILHSRPKDRGVMEQALESLEMLSRMRADSSASQIRDVLQQLLIVEGRVAEGKCYEIEGSMTFDSGWPEYSYRWDGLRFEFCVPSFGGIQFKPRSISDQVSMTTSFVENCDLPDIAPNNSLNLGVDEITAISPLPSQNEHEHEAEWELFPSDTFRAPEMAIHPARTDSERQEGDIDCMISHYALPEWAL